MILVNGDSWTGGRLDEDGSVLDIEYWPNFFEKITNIPITNLGTGGASNQKIFRTTIDFLYNTSQPISHVVIGWSNINRFEITTSSNNSLNFMPDRMHGDHNIPRPVKEQFKHLYYKWCHNHQTNLKNFLHLVLILQDVCRQKNIQLINFQSFSDNYKMIKLYSDDEMINLKNQIDLNFFIESTMQERTKEYPLHKSGHVNEEGNQRWAEILIEKFNF